MWAAGVRPAGRTGSPCRGTHAWSPEACEPVDNVAPSARVRADAVTRHAAARSRSQERAEAATAQLRAEVPDAKVEFLKVRGA